MSSKMKIFRTVCVIVCLFAIQMAAGQDSSAWIDGAKFYAPGTKQTTPPQDKKGSLVAQGTVKYALPPTPGIYEVEFVFCLNNNKGLTQGTISAGSRTRKLLYADSVVPLTEIREKITLYQTDENIKKGEISISIGCRYTLSGVSIQRVSDLYIEALSVDRVLYEPGDTVKASLSLSKAASKASNAKIKLWRNYLFEEPELLAELDASAAVDGKIVYSYPAGSREFGQRLTAEFLMEGKTRQQKDEVYSIAKSVWDVYLGTDSTSHTHASAELKLENLCAFFSLQRTYYCNAMEKFFWAPDDWGNMNPDNPRWFSGQTRRYESAEMMQKQIDIAHQHGMKALTYGKGSACGASGFELYRQHPAWFKWLPPADVYDIEHWDDAAPEKPIKNSWYWFPPDLMNETVLNYGIDQIIASAKRFGWDGVRFDGHFSVSDPYYSYFNMRRLKERTWKELPKFQFGFNMPMMGEIDWKLSDEHKEALAGGGLWMNEGIGQWRKQNGAYYNTIGDYIRTELRAAEFVYDHGGVYLHMMGMRRPCRGSAADNYYKFVGAIFAGIRPSFGDHIYAPGCDNWGYFITRWNSLFWNSQRRKLDCDANKISFAEEPKNLFWREWARIIPGAGTDVVWSIPMLLLPANDAIGSCTFPPDASGLKLRLSAECISNVKSVNWVTPDNEPTSLFVSSSGEIELPSIHIFGILVITLKNSDLLPIIVREPFAKIAVAKPTKPMDNTYVAVDPNKPEANRDPRAKNDNNPLQKYATNYGVSLRYSRIEDTEAVKGVAAGADKGCPSAIAGVYYWDILPPGKYRAIARVKATRYNIAKPRIGLRFREFPKKNTGKFPGSDFGIAKKLSELSGEGKWDEVLITDHFIQSGRGSCMVTMSAELSKTDPIDAKIMLDWVRLEMIEAFNDQQLSDYMKLPKATLSTVAAKSKVLHIRGVFDNLYRIPDAVKLAYGENAQLTTIYPRDIPALVASLSQNNNIAAGASEADESSNSDSKETKHSDTASIPETSDSNATDKPHTVGQQNKSYSEYLSGFGTIVLSNTAINSISLEDRKAYVDWVNAGGILVLTGGHNAFANSAMQRTFFENILPCTVPSNLAQKEPPFTFMPDNKSNPITVYYIHSTKAHPGARLFWGTEQCPLLIGGKAGKGACIVFTGSVLGAPADAKEAFWNNSLWPKKLAEAITAMAAGAEN